MPWPAALEENQQSIGVEDRVVLLVPSDKWFEGIPKRKAKLKWRTEPYSVGDTLPAPEGVYTIEGSISGGLGDIFFRWSPEDVTGWLRWLGPQKRTHRVRWRMWRKEVLALDLFPFSTLTRYAFHTAAAPEDPYVRHMLRIAWRFRALNDEGIPALPRVVAQHLNADPNEILPEVWGGLLSWRLANDCAPLPAPDNLLGVSAMLPYIEDWIAANRNRDPVG
jgi:hypothetical protein